jgi:hypothetical protein
MSQKRTGALILSQMPGLRLLRYTFCLLSAGTDAASVLIAAVLVQFLKEVDATHWLRLFRPDGPYTQNSFCFRLISFQFYDNDEAIISLVK